MIPKSIIQLYNKSHYSSNFAKSHKKVIEKLAWINHKHVDHYILYILFKLYLHPAKPLILIKHYDKKSDYLYNNGLTLEKLGLIKIKRLGFQRRTLHITSRGLFFVNCEISNRLSCNHILDRMITRIRIFTTYKKSFRHCFVCNDLLNFFKRSSYKVDYNYVKDIIKQTIQNNEHITDSISYI